MSGSVKECQVSDKHLWKLTITWGSLGQVSQECREPNYFGKQITIVIGSATLQPKWSRLAGAQIGSRLGWQRRCRGAWVIPATVTATMF